MPLIQYSAILILSIWVFVIILARNQIWTLLKDLRSYLRSIVQDSHTLHRLLLILVVGGFLRILTIGTHLYPTYEEVVAFYLDDANATKVSVQMVRGRTLNPHWFQHPSLSYYLNAILFSPFVLVSSSDYRILYIIARSVNFVCSLCTILVVFQLGTEIRDKSTGLLSALFLTINPLDIHYCFTAIRWEYSRATLLISIAILYLTRTVKEGKRKNFLVASIFSGLATTTLYQAGLLIIFIPIVYFLVRVKTGRQDRLPTNQGLKYRDIVYALGLMITTFLVVSPFVFLAYDEFRNGFSDVLNLNVESVSSVSVDPIYSIEWFDYAIFPLTPLFFLSLISVPLFIVRPLAQQKKKIDYSMLVPLIWTLSSLALAMFVFFHHERVWHHLPILPSLSLIIGSFFAELLDVSKAKTHQYIAWFRMYAGSIIILGISILSFTTALGQQLSTFHDTYSAAANWAQDNLEPGSTVLCFWHTFVSPEQFDLVPAQRILMATDIAKIQPDYIFLPSYQTSEYEFVNMVLTNVFAYLDYTRIKEFRVDPQYIGHYESLKSNHGFFGIAWIIAALTTDDLMYGYDIFVYAKIEMNE